jgi:hypothetical protein
MGFFLGWFVGLVVLLQENFYSALAALVGPVENNFFLTVHFLNSSVSIGQTAVLGSLSLRMGLWFEPPHPDPQINPVAEFIDPCLGG